MIPALLVLATLYAVSAESADKEYVYKSENIKGYLFAKHDEAVVQRQWEYAIPKGQKSAELMYPHEYNCDVDGVERQLVMLSIEVQSDELPANVFIEAEQKKVAIFRNTQYELKSEAVVFVTAYCLKLEQSKKS